MKLNKIQTTQDSFRLTELKHRSIAESNFERVNFWSMVYMLVLVCVGIFQVAHYKVSPTNKQLFIIVRIL